MSDNYMRTRGQLTAEDLARIASMTPAPQPMATPHPMPVATPRPSPAPQAEPGFWDRVIRYFRGQSEAQGPISIDSQGAQSLKDAFK